MVKSTGLVCLVLFVTVSVAAETRLRDLATQFNDAYGVVSELEYAGQDEGDFGPIGGDRREPGDFPADSAEQAKFDEGEENFMKEEAKEGIERFERQKEREERRLKREAEREARKVAKEDQHLKNRNLRQALRNEDRAEKKDAQVKRRTGRMDTRQDEGAQQSNKRFSPSIPAGRK